MKEKYDDLSAASERMRSEISQLETSRHNAQQQYDNTLATNGQIKMEIAKRDNAQSTYSSMVNHNNSTNSRIASLVLERDNLQNNYINPYISALQEARNALGILAFETVVTMKMVAPFDFRIVEERKYADKYYHNVTIATKHTNRVFGIKVNPSYSYHTERTFNQEWYNNDVIAINSRITNAENQLNVQKATYQGKIDTLNTEISSKQSSLYSPVLLEQALQTLNTANQAVASIGITLETSEKQVANSLQILKDTSSALKSKQADLDHNEQKKGQVAEKLKLEKLEAERIKAEQLRIQKLEAERLQAEKLKLEKLEAERIKAEQLRIQKLEAERLQAEKLKLEKLEAERIKAEQLRIQKLEAERLQAEKLELERLEAERIKAEQLEAQRLEAERLQAEKLELERLEAERIKAEQLEIQRLEAERLQAEKLELERLEAERIKAEQLEIQRLEAERLQAEKLLESLAIIEEVETTENILGLNENQGFEAEVNIDLSGNII